MWVGLCHRLSGERRDARAIHITADFSVTATEPFGRLRFFASQISEAKSLERSRIVQQFIMFNVTQHHLEEVRGLTLCS